MTLYRRLVARAADQHGYVTTGDAREEGGTPMALVMLAQRGTLEHIDRGLYRVPELAGDPLGEYQEALLRVPGAVLSHDTALEIHDLADVNPRRVHVTLPPNLRLRREIPDWITLHQETIEPVDVTAHEGLRIVTPARAILDAIHDKLGARFVEQALATAKRRNLLTTPEDQRIKRAVGQQRTAYAVAAE